MSEKKLNKQQKKAVEYTDGPLLIVAGAGTGKTTVISEKISYLVKNGHAKPEEILALTFTDKAAQEMQDRVDSQLDFGYLDLSISTFHTFCQRLLERYGLDIGISNDFRLLTQTDAWLLMKERLYDFELDYYRPMGNPTKHIHEFLKHFSKCKDELISPESYVAHAENIALESGDANKDEKTRLTEIANTYHAYNQMLLDAGALDFGDLIYYAVELLQKRSTILDRLQTQYKFILVDEFQDVNFAQFELVRLISEKSQLTVVGDDDQSIYAFRGASVSNIMKFKDHFADAHEVVLTSNYRSDQQILDASYKLIQNNNPDRLEMKLDIVKKLDSKLKIGKATLEHMHFSSIEQEVRGVVEKILECKSANTESTWDDFAILVRANNHAEPFIAALENAGVPYEFLATAGLYRQPVVLDAINFFKSIDQYKESSALYRLLRLPNFEFPENDMQKIATHARKKSISYYEALKRATVLQLSQKGIKISDKLISLIHTGMKQARNEKPSIVLYHFFEDSGYLTWLTKEEGKGNRYAIRQIHQLKQFFDFLEKYEQAIPDAHVKHFLEYFMTLVASGDQGKLYQPVDTPDSVNIMTMHGAKGLEFKYVFMVNMVEDRFPSRRRGEAMPIPDDLVKEVLPEGDAHFQEERRLCYVGMTRAKQELYFTSADFYGGVRKKKVSRFLEEIGMTPQMQGASNNVFKSSTKLEQQEMESTSVDKPTIFSFSQIKSYQTCPYQYKLAHILKIPTKGNHSFSFGSTIHNTLQKFYEEVQRLNIPQQESLFSVPTSVEHQKQESKDIVVPQFEYLMKLYEDAWIPDWYENRRQRDEYYKKGKELLKIFYESQDGVWTVPTSLEQSFKIQVGNVVLRGRIDRVDQLEDGTLEIIDYKTGKSKEKLSTDDKDQLLIYQIATQTLPEYRNIGETSKLTFYYVNDNLRTSFVGTDAELEKLQQKIIKTVDGIHARDFSPKPTSFACTYCDFRDICEFRYA